MLYEDLVAQFGTPSSAAHSLGVDRRSVDGWKKRRIPTKHQLKAAALRPGVLVPDEQARKEGEELASILINPEARAA